MRSEADVFITNVRTDGLTRAGFNYDDIKEEFPHLVRCGATCARELVCPTIALSGLRAPHGLGPLRQRHESTRHVVQRAPSAAGSRSRTGYDIGAFWSVTGMASEIHQPMCYSGACRAALFSVSSHRRLCLIVHRGR
jgi:hypothetical protein